MSYKVSKVNMHIRQWTNISLQNHVYIQRRKIDGNTLHKETQTLGEKRFKKKGLLWVLGSLSSGFCIMHILYAKIHGNGSLSVLTWEDISNMCSSSLHVVKPSLLTPLSIPISLFLLLSSIPFSFLSFSSSLPPLSLSSLILVIPSFPLFSLIRPPSSSPPLSASTSTPFIPSIQKHEKKIGRRIKVNAILWSLADLHFRWKRQIVPRVWDRFDDIIWNRETFTKGGSCFHEK